ncbi:MAG: aspartoacylase [Synechococcaceae cyanobacterium]
MPEAGGKEPLASSVSGERPGSSNNTELRGDAANNATQLNLATVASQGADANRTAQLDAVSGLAQPIAASGLPERGAARGPSQQSAASSASQQSSAAAAGWLDAGDAGIRNRGKSGANGGDEGETGWRLRSGAGDHDQEPGEAVLVVAGTHGNERNGVRLLRQWHRQPELLHHAGLEVVLCTGNPAAVEAGRRYLERDLNRSFQAALLQDPLNQQHEVQRARALLAAWGPAGSHPCPVVLDLHSTTAVMGNSLVVYGRRPADLALAAGLQGRLGLPVYLHENDPHQSGYLVERWPCGLVIEVGPVPQGVINPRIGQQTQLALEAALGLLAEAQRGPVRLPRTLVVHRHLRSLDLPRHRNGEPSAWVHPQRQDRDWQPLHPGDPLFWSETQGAIGWEPRAGDPEIVWPLFINEAAYEEKGIALSLSQRDEWPVDPAWGTALEQVAQRLHRQPPLVTPTE